MSRVKICGLQDAANLDVAIDAGADMVGFVLEPKSPRYVSVDAVLNLAPALAGTPLEPWLVLQDRPDMTQAEITRWEGLIRSLPALDAAFRAAVGLQVHTQPPGYVARALKTQAGPRPFAAALPVSTPEDLTVAARHDVAHRILLDAKPPKDAAYAGGHGQSFDWMILENWSLRATTEGRLSDDDWVLAGGLTPHTVADAIAVTRAPAVDVSSGVESAPGVKDSAKIRDFIAAAHAA